MSFSFPQLDWDAVYFVDGKATLQFQLLWSQIAENFNALAAAQAAQAAADTAQAAAVTAQAAAASASTDAAAADAAATTAQTSADGANSVAALTASGVTGLTITATDAGANVTVTLSAHTRVYGDGTTVSVNGGSVTALSYSTLYYIYYDQASRAGGAVTYAATTSETTAAQVGDRHLVGSVMTPAAAAPPTDGDYVRAPGVGGILP